MMAARRTLAIAGPLAIMLSGCGTSSGAHVSAPALADDPYTFDRSIDLSAATGPLPLDTPDDAARAAIGARLFYSSALDTLVSGKAARAKDTSNCPDGGTKTSNSSSTSRSESYDQCLDGYRYLDGYWSAEITSPGYPWSNAQAQLGQNNTTFLGNLQEVQATANLVGAESALDDKPRMNYGVDGDQLDVKLDGSDYLINESGDFRLTRDCGVGKATVGTSRDLRVNKDTGAVTDGQLDLSNGNGQTASVVFNADQSVDATAGAATMHYTIGDFRALCPF